MIKIKDATQIAKMRVASRLTAQVLDMITPYVKAGVTTGYLNDLCHELIVKQQQAIPAPLNYHGFPKSICTSVNHVICHGIPGDKKLKKGDIINIDISVKKNGFIGDSSRMFSVGKTSPLASKLIDVCYKAMHLGIEQVKPGNRLGDIGHVIQKYVEGQRFSIVREYCGHGVGEEFHEEPQVLHYGTAGTGVEIKEGMIFTIEPMINAGARHTRLLGDGWTVVTKDHSLSAQWEHTILVTPSGHEILTVTDHYTG
jgi:methionyl aminopeptidase